MSKATRNANGLLIGGSFFPTFGARHCATPFGFLDPGCLFLGDLHLGCTLRETIAGLTRSASMAKEAMRAICRAPQLEVETSPTIARNFGRIGDRIRFGVHGGKR
jgi:hypothetical protein